MALHELTDDGNMKWLCLKCGKEHSAHISHEQIEHPQVAGEIDRSVVALPACECGMRMFLNVRFQEHELRVPDHPSHSEEQRQANRHRETTIQRHMTLAQQMIAAGKAPAVDESEQPHA